MMLAPLGAARGHSGEGRTAEVLARYSRLTIVKKRLAGIRTVLASTAQREAIAAGWQPHSLARRLGRDQIDRLVSGYLAGVGSTVLARRYGVSENSVLAQLKRSGVKLRPPGKVSADDVTEMARLRHEGWTYTAIGEKFGITRTAVSRRLQSI